MYRKFLISLLIFSLLLSSGCWDRNEVNESVLVMAQGIDSTKNNQIVVTVQLPPPQQPAGGSTEALPFLTVSAAGSTAVGAARRIGLKSARTLLWQHMAAVIFGEEVCRKGLSGLIDLEARSRNVRKTEQFFIARNCKAADILGLPVPPEDIPAVALASMVKNQDRLLGTYTPIILDEFIKRSADPGIEPAVPGVAIVNPANGQPYLELSGTAVFKEGKLVGWLNTIESKGYRWLRPQMVTGGLKTISCPICDKPVVIDTIRSKCQMEPEVRNGKVTIKINIKEEGLYYEQRCMHQLLTPRMIQVLNKRAELLIKKQITMAVDKAQEYDSDIFGFGALLRKQQPAQWRKLGPEWSEVFPTVRLIIQVDSKIRRTNLRFRVPPLRY